MKTEQFPMPEPETDNEDQMAAKCDKREWLRWQRSMK